MSICEKCGFPNDPGYIGDSRMCICQNTFSNLVLPYDKEKGMYVYDENTYISKVAFDNEIGRAHV